MNRIKVGVCLAVVAACLTAVAPVAKEQDKKKGESIAITNVRIFDGDRMIPDGTVIITGQTITYVGTNATKIPDGAQVIDGTGKTLMPGMIDGHAHDWGWGVERALVFGVTTELEMFGDGPTAQYIRNQEAVDGAPQWASLVTAGTLATVPGGHGTQYGLAIPTLTQPSDAQPWVDGRLAEGSDFIKIALEDGSPYRFPTPWPTLDRATMAAVIDAAHARKKLAVAHISEESYARWAIEENVDGLVHIFQDAPATPGFAALAAQRKVFVVPTLSVLESTTGVASGQSLTTDPRLAPYLTAEEIENLRASFRNWGGLSLAPALTTVAELHAAGVPILAGTDVANPGTAWGVSMHREIELLVSAGLSPLAALRSATSVAADAFELKDRGRIKQGLRADLLLVNGNPENDITNTRDIARVWKLGHEVVRTPVGGAPSLAMKRAFQEARAHAHLH